MPPLSSHRTLAYAAGPQADRVNHRACRKRRFLESRSRWFAGRKHTLQNPAAALIFVAVYEPESFLPNAEGGGEDEWLSRDSHDHAQPA
jgi:hypothetical protein